MLRGLRWSAVAAVLLATAGTPASAQYYGGQFGWGGWGWGGGTAQGDIARGMGAYASGVGAYNAETAQAASINADTMMRWNTYLWASQHAINVERQQRLTADFARDKKARADIARRISDNPNNVDIERGDALNAILEQLSNPKIHPSALKMTRIPLNSDWIKNIPFRYESEAVTLSLHRMTAEHGWPEALRADAFKAEREGYQKAIDAALAEDKEKDLSPKTIDAVNDAVQALRVKVEKTIPKTGRDYIDAENYIKGLAGMAKMLKSPRIDETLAALEKYPGTTIADLLSFMQMFNLRFGPADDPDERALYQQLYPLLDAQRDSIMQQMAGKVPDPDAPPAVAAGAPPTEIFHSVPWEHLDPKKAPPATPVPAAPNR